MSRSRASIQAELREIFARSPDGKQRRTDGELIPMSNRQFHIFGDYGLEDQTTLEVFDSSSEAIRWAKQYCRRDMGGYEAIEVIEFAADGEAITHWRLLADD